MRRDGNCPHWHNSGPLLWHSKTAQYRSGSVPVPASAVVFEAEKCWQLQGAGVVAVVPLGAGQDVQGVVAPMQYKSNQGKISLQQWKEVLIHHSQGKWKEISLQTLKVLCTESTRHKQKQRVRRDQTKDVRSYYSHRRHYCKKAVTTATSLHPACLLPMRWWSVSIWPFTKTE